MKPNIESAKINFILNLITDNVVSCCIERIRNAGFEVKQEGSGTDIALSIKVGEKEVKFHLYNLLMEIATVDRDEKPLRLDMRLEDYDFFLRKSCSLIESKLTILFELLL